MNPGQIDFGTVVRRPDQSPTASLTLTYAGGRSDWEVTKMKTQSSKVKAELRELSRTADGQINYSLTATLQPGVSNGYFKDEIKLLTNDQSSPSIPISVVANIRSAVGVNPSIINSGAFVRVSRYPRLSWSVPRRPSRSPNLRPARKIFSPTKTRKDHEPPNS